MYAIVFWEDSTFTVISLSNIVSPRKEINEYAVGEAVKARFGGKMYNAHIYEISDDRAALNKQLKDGMKLDLQRLQIDVPSHPVEPLMSATPILSEPTKKRPKPSCDLPKKKSNTTKRPKKTCTEEPASSAAPLAEATSIQQKEPLVEQAMQILQKRRAQLNVSSPIAAPESCMPTNQTSPMPQNQVTPVSQNQMWSPMQQRQTSPVVQQNETSQVPSWSTSMTPYTSVGYSDNFGPSQQQWQYDQPVISHSGFLFSTPERIQHGSYLSMLNSSPETEQTETRGQECTKTVDMLEQRIAELDAQVKALQQELQKTVVTPPRMPQIPQRRQNLSNTMHMGMLQGNGSSAHEIIKSAIEFETRMPRAIAKAMKAVFTTEQLSTCSFKGGITTKGYPRVGLPEAEREAVIDVISRKFEASRSTIETKMRTALRRFFVMFK